MEYYSYGCDQPFESAHKRILTTSILLFPHVENATDKRVEVKLPPHMPSVH